jgi:hypothetical protein
VSAAFEGCCFRSQARSKATKDDMCDPSMALAVEPRVTTNAGRFGAGRPGSERIWQGLRALAARVIRPGDAPEICRAEILQIEQIAEKPPRVVGGLGLPLAVVSCGGNQAHKPVGARSDSLHQ